MSKLVEYTDSDSDSDYSMDVPGIEKLVDLGSLSASLVAVNLIQNGSERWQRIGRSVHMKCLHLACATAAFSSVDNRPFFVVYDRSPNGVLPAYTDIFSGYTQSGGSSNFYFLNPDFDDRFEVLFSSMQDLTIQQMQAWSADQSTSASGVYFHICVDLFGRVVQYKADSSPAVIGDVATGALYVTSFSNTNIISQVRLEYVD